MGRAAPVAPSVIAAVAVAAWVLVIGAFFAALGALPFFSGVDSGNPGALFAILDPSSLVYVALALGLFLSFWVIAPIRGDLPIRRALTRSVVAAALALIPVAAVYFGISSVLIAQSSDQFSGGLYDLVETTPPPGPLDTAIRSIVGAVQTVATKLPHIALAALGSWAWQRRTAHGEA